MLVQKNNNKNANSDANFNDTAFVRYITQFFMPLLRLWHYIVIPLLIFALSSNDDYCDEKYTQSKLFHQEQIKPTK